MMRFIGMLYGVVCYILGLTALIAFVLFANNFFGFVGEKYVSLNIDAFNSRPSDYPVLMNLGLLLLFALQHSVMARPAFKRIITKVLPTHLERSTYVLATAVVLVPLIQFWQPMIADSLWSVESPTYRALIQAAYFMGFGVTVAATYMLNHNHLFGLQQAAGRDMLDKEFRTPFLYRHVRHPIQTGVLIAMLATPDMTFGRALLAAGMIVYIFIGLYFEERDLITEFGDAYLDYKKRVPALIPNPFKGN